MAELFIFVVLAGALSLVFGYVLRDEDRKRRVEQKLNRLFEER